MNKLLSKIGAALACALTSLALAACGGTQGGPAAATTPSIPTEDVVGIWQVSDNTSGSSDWAAMADKGIYTFYHFEQDGTFSIEGVLPGAGHTRTGTWKIDGKKVLINLPEENLSASTDDGGDAGSGTEAVTGGKAPAIENGEVSIDGDTLTTDAVGQGTTTAKRISEDDYNAAMEKSKALGPQDVAVGQAVDTDAFSFTVDSISYEQEIYPSDTSGYYNYYEDQDGTTYLVANVTFTNKGTDAAVPGWSTSATLTVNGNNYQATPEVDGGTMTSQSYSVEAQQTSQMVIWAAVPDNVVDTGEVTLTWSLPRAASGLGQYYSANGDNATYRVK